MLKEHILAGEAYSLGGVILSKEKGWSFFFFLTDLASREKDHLNKNLLMKSLLE